MDTRVQHELKLCDVDVHRTIEPQPSCPQWSRGVSTSPNRLLASPTARRCLPIPPHPPHHRVAPAPARRWNLGTQALARKGMRLPPPRKGISISRRRPKSRLRTPPRPGPTRPRARRVPTSWSRQMALARTSPSHIPSRYPSAVAPRTCKNDNKFKKWV